MTAVGTCGWEAADTWVVSVPSLAAAQRFMSSGWTVTDSINIQYRLSELKAQNGDFPRFDLGDHARCDEVFKKLSAI
jgi:hypothetical protein